MSLWRHLLTASFWNQNNQNFKTCITFLINGQLLWSFPQNVYCSNMFGRWFTCNVKHYFLWKIWKHAFENVVCQLWLALKGLIVALWCHIAFMNIQNGGSHNCKCLYISTLVTFLYMYWFSWKLVPKFIVWKELQY